LIPFDLAAKPHFVLCLPNGGDGGLGMGGLIFKERAAWQSWLSLETSATFLSVAMSVVSSFWG